MVLSARPARRHVAVDAAIARVLSFRRPALAPRRAAPTVCPRIFPLVVSSMSCFLFGLGMQASGVLAAGDAAVCPGFGLLSEFARAARPPASGFRSAAYVAVALAYGLPRHAFDALDCQRHPRC